MFMKTTLAAAALTFMVAAPALAGDDSYGIDDRYDTSTNYDLPSAQNAKDFPAVRMERTYMQPRDPVARQERMINRTDRNGNR